MSDDQIRAHVRRAAFSAFLKRHNTTAKALARDAGLKHSSGLYNFVNAISDNLSRRTLEKLGKATGENPERILVPYQDDLPETVEKFTLAQLLELDGKPSRRQVQALKAEVSPKAVKRARDRARRKAAAPVRAQALAVQVTCAVQAGKLRTTPHLPLEEQFEAPVPITPEQLAAGAYGAIVRSPGAELIYPDGTMLVVMPLSSFRGTVEDGKRLLVQRVRDNQVEVTVREVKTARGRTQLHLMSSDPKLQKAAITVPRPLTPTWTHDDDHYTLGVVIGAYTWYN